MKKLGIVLLALLAFTFTANASEVTTTYEGNWIIDVSESIWDDSKEVHASVFSNTKRTDWLGDYQKGAFSFGCHKNITIVMFVPRSIKFSLFDGNIKPKVKYRIDKEKTKTANWRNTEETTGIHGLEAMSFLRDLYFADVEKLALGTYSPAKYIGGFSDHTFDVSGIKPQIERVANACNWKI